MLQRSLLKLCDASSNGSNRGLKGSPAASATNRNVEAPRDMKPLDKVVENVSICRPECAKRCKPWAWRCSGACAVRTRPAHRGRRRARQEANPYLIGISRSRSPQCPQPPSDHEAAQPKSQEHTAAAATCVASCGGHCPRATVQERARQQIPFCMDVYTHLS